MQEKQKLTTKDHSRESAGLHYVYPVISRRAGGLSVGINLNPNNACNWRCVYCQVPDLKRGSAPDIDLKRLASELRYFLHDVLSADFFDRYEVESDYRKICDIALSGNGEPTSCKRFEEVIGCIEEIMVEFDLRNRINLVLITNGSLVHHKNVQAGLKRMDSLNGVVWFKLDRAFDAEAKKINNTALSVARTIENLIIATQLCSTWVQTSVFQFDGKAMSDEEQNEYAYRLETVIHQGGRLKGVLVYGLARPSLQPEASRLSPVSASWLKGFSERIQALGLELRITG